MEGCLKMSYFDLYSEVLKEVTTFNKDENGKRYFDIIDMSKEVRYILDRIIESELTRECFFIENLKELLNIEYFDKVSKSDSKKIIRQQSISNLNIGRIDHDRGWIIGSSSRYKLYGFKEHKEEKLIDLYYLYVSKENQKEDYGLDFTRRIFYIKDKKIRLLEYYLSVIVNNVVMRRANENYLSLLE